MDMSALARATTKNSREIARIEEVQSQAARKSTKNTRANIAFALLTWTTFIYLLLKKKK